MGREIKVRGNMRKGIKRIGTKKKDQIEQTAANQKFMVEEWLNGRYWDPITKGLAQSRKKIDAIRVKVTKLLKYYRFEEPLFNKLSDRSSCPFTRRENNQLVLAFTISPYIKKAFKNPFDYMGKVFGRPEEQLREQLDKLLGKNKKSLFNL